MKHSSICYTTPCGHGTNIFIDEMEVDCQCVFPPPKGLDLDCSICFGSLYVDPYQNIVCGHHFCGSCAHKLREEGQPCPVCRQPLNIIQDLGLQRTLKSLQVYCNNKGKGCQWEGELGGLQDHCTDEHNGCLYSEVHCINNCGYRGLRHTIRDHMESDCPYRPMRCEYCEYQSTWEEVTGVHVDMCQLYPVTCVCGIVMTRTDLSNHKGINCPNDKIEFEFADYKCEWQGERQQLHDHLQENWRSHMEAVVSLQVTETKAKFDTQTELFHEKVNELEEYVYMLESTIESQKEKIRLLEERVEIESDKVERLLDANVDHFQYRMEILEEEMKDRLTEQFKGLEEKWTEKLISQPLEQETQLSELSESLSELYVYEDSICSSEEENEDVFGAYNTSVSYGHPIFKTQHYPKFVYRLKKFTKQKHKRKTCFSQPFYTDNPGYRMCLRVHPNGYGKGEEHYLSVYVCLLRGEFDGQLNWPFVGSVTICLVAARGNDHLQKIARYSRNTPPEFSTVKGKFTSKGNGFPTFISHQELVDPSLQYLQNDTLIFEVTEVLCKS